MSETTPKPSVLDQMVVLCRQLLEDQSTPAVMPEEGVTATDSSVTAEEGNSSSEEK